MVEPGRRCLGDRYELVALIAAGGMGQVWRGTDVLLGRPVAVKVLHSEYTGDPTFVARFRAEAHHAASLSHPNIAAVFDYGETIAQDGSGETLAYLVMELIEGEPLSTVLQREGRLECERTLDLLRQAAAGLGEAHRRGLVHRDVKPGNMLVRSDGRVKLTDFGIAWSAGSVPLTRTGQVIGTPQYLSPEQAEGHGASPASDVYALGLVGYECLVGHPAFDGDNAVTIALKQVREQPEPLPAELPAGIRQLIGRALAKDPAGRLADGSAFAAAIDDARAGRELPPPPTVDARWVAAGGADAPHRGAAAWWAGAETPDDETRGAGAYRPLHETGPVRTPPARRGLARRLAVVLAPVLALLAGAGIAAAVLVGLSDGRPQQTAVAADTGAGDTVVLVPASYVGRPVDDVATQLSAFGLTVQRRGLATAGTAPGTVTDVGPAGVRLHRGDTVFVTYAIAPSAPGPAPSLAEAARSAPLPSAEPTRAPRRTRAATAATTTDPSTSPSTSAAPTTSAAPSSTPPVDSGSATPSTTPPASSSGSAGSSSPPASSSSGAPPSSSSPPTSGSSRSSSRSSSPPASGSAAASAESSSASTTTGDSRSSV